MTKQAAISEFYETMRSENIDYLRVINILLMETTSAAIKRATEKMIKK